MVLFLSQSLNAVDSFYQQLWLHLPALLGTSQIPVPCTCVSSSSLPCCTLFKLFWVILNLQRIVCILPSLPSFILLVCCSPGFCSCFLPFVTLSFELPLIFLFAVVDLWLSDYVLDFVCLEPSNKVNLFLHMSPTSICDNYIYISRNEDRLTFN